MNILSVLSIMMNDDTVKLCFPMWRITLQSSRVSPLIFIIVFPRILPRLQITRHNTMNIVES